MPRQYTKRSIHKSGTLRHGYARHGKIRSEWQAWNHMIQRCYNPKDNHFKDYGARGIIVCERWRVSFDAFLKDMGDKPTPKHSLDRIKSNENYEPGNCRWATPQEQSQNRRTVIWIEHDGIRDCVAGWVRRTKIKRTTILARFHKGWSSDRILTPVN